MSRVGGIDGTDRATRVAQRDIADRVADLVEIDHDGRFTNEVTVVQNGADALDEVAALLAQAGGAIAERRGSRRVRRVEWAKDDDDDDA